MPPSLSWLSTPVYVLSRFSRVCLFSTPWTVALQDPLSTEFSRQEYGVGCHFLPQGIVPTQGWNPRLSCLLLWQVGSLPVAPPEKPSECLPNEYYFLEPVPLCDTWMSPPLAPTVNDHPRGQARHSAQHRLPSTGLSPRHAEPLAITETTLTVLWELPNTPSCIWCLSDRFPLHRTRIPQNFKKSFPL